MKRKKPTHASPLMPERIGRYDVLLPIASGGMGTVYLAVSRGVGGFERQVAVKIMHAHLRDEDNFAHDLIEEAKLAGRIKHPNVVQVLDVGDDPLGVFLVMEYVEGDSLAGLRRTLHKVEGQLFPPRVGLRILTDALRGLHAAHELSDDDGAPLGLVHRDFSPQNILVGTDGISRLTDFGVAKARTRLTHTATGLVKGKIHYMSPEQAKTEPIDRRCDVWAAGVIAWELLAGRALYKDRNETSILLQLITEPPPRLRTVKRDVPKALDDAVAFALASAVHERCPSASALARALEEGTSAIGGLAEAHEVASFVREHAGVVLAKRRAHMAEVRKLREEMSSIALDATADSEITTPTLGRRVSSTPPPRPELTSTEVTEPMRPDPPALLGERPRDEPSVTEISQSLSMRPRPGRAGRGRLLAGAAVALLAVGGLGWGLGRSSPEHDGLEPPAQPGAGGAPAVPAAASESAAPSASTAGSSAASDGAASAEPATVAVRANAAVREVRVGTRIVPVEPASTSVSLALLAEERDRPMQLVARAVDGRLASVKLDAGQREIEVRFLVPVRPAAPRPTTGAAPLAPSPYDP